MIQDPNGFYSLPVCDCNHAGEKHRNRKTSCEACGCVTYRQADPNKVPVRGSLSSTRRPPERIE